MNLKTKGGYQMHSFKFNIGNSKGIATILGLFMLFIATIAGIALIYMSRKDKSASIDSSAIRNVAFAADAALGACENKMKIQPDTLIAILNKYLKNHNYKWLLSPSTSAALTEKKISFGNNGMSYSAQISAFDTSNMILQIQGFGYGRNNEQKSIIGIYKISGLKETNKIGDYALYLAGDGKDFNAKINITGNVFCGGDFHFNGGADYSVIHGNLKTGLNINLLSGFDCPVTIDSAVYVGTALRINSPILIKSKFGIDGAIKQDNIFTIKGDAWFNYANGGNGKTNISGFTIHHSGLVNMARILNGIEDNRGAMIPDIVGEIGLNTVDSPWSVDTSILSPLANSITGIDAATLQTMYDTCSNSRKINGYMVLTGPSVIAINPSPAVFKGKVIWLVHSGMDINNHWINTDTSSRMLVYADRTAELRGFGGPNGMAFRGYIFLTGNSSVQFNGSGKNYYYGAIHLVSKTAGWQLNGGFEEFIIYDKSILSEFISMGVIKAPIGTGTSGKAGSYVLSDFKIRTQLLGKVF